MRELDGINGHEPEQTPGVGEGQGSLACCSPWGRKESDMTGQLNNRTAEPNDWTFSELGASVMKNAVSTAHWHESHIRTRRSTAGHREGKAAWGPPLYLLDRHTVRAPKRKEEARSGPTFQPPRWSPKQ